MFKDLVKLQQKYPIGTKVNVKEFKSRKQMPYYNEKDLIEYRRKYGKVTVLDDSYCYAMETRVMCNVVEGYLFDGKQWRIVENTWDGWLPIDLDEEEEPGEVVATKDE